MNAGREHDKFKEIGLIPQKSERANAPLMLGFPNALECKLVCQVKLGMSTMFVGEIVEVVANSEVLSPNQVPDIVILSYDKALIKILLYDKIILKKRSYYVQARLVE